MGSKYKKTKMLRPFEYRHYADHSLYNTRVPVKNHGLIIRLAVIRLAIHLPDEQLVYLLAPLFFTVLPNVAYIIYHLF